MKISNKVVCTIIDPPSSSSEGFKSVETIRLKVGSHTIGKLKSEIMDDINTRLHGGNKELEYQIYNNDGIDDEIKVEVGYSFALTLKFTVNILPQKEVIPTKRKADIRGPLGMIKILAFCMSGSASSVLLGIIAGSIITMCKAEQPGVAHKGKPDIGKLLALTSTCILLAYTMRSVLPPLGMQSQASATPIFKIIGCVAAADLAATIAGTILNSGLNDKFLNNVYNDVKSGYCQGF